MLSMAEAIERYPVFLTDGAVGLRLENEYGLTPDPEIKYAGMVLDPQGRRALAEIYDEYLHVAQEEDLPILLMSNTRRAAPERLARSAYRGREVAGEFVAFLRERAKGYRCPAFIGGQMGCHGDAYTGEGALPRKEARAYHREQVEAFRRARPDFIFAGIMPDVEEIIGLVGAVADVDLPCVVSLMLRRDGRMPDGSGMAEAIQAIDAAAPRRPLFYISNCVHPNVLRQALEQPFNQNPIVRERFFGLQANAADADAEALDGREGVVSASPEALAADFARLWDAFPLRLLGGCCGTDARHMKQIAGLCSLRKRGTQ